MQLARDDSFGDRIASQIPPSSKTLTKQTQETNFVDERASKIGDFERLRKLPDRSSTRYGKTPKSC